MRSEKDGTARATCKTCVRLSHSIKDYLLTYLLTYIGFPNPSPLLRPWRWTRTGWTCPGSIFPGDVRTPGFRIGTSLRRKWICCILLCHEA